MTTIRRGLPRAAVDRLRDALAPGSEVVRVRPLRGGVSSSVHLVHLRSPDGVQTAVVVRRYGEYWQRKDPAACSREFELLSLLADTSFPAPRPLLVDAAGGPFGAPTVVMTRLPGRPLLEPKDLPSYLEQMARTLAHLHSLPVAAFDFLPRQEALVGAYLVQPQTREDPLEQAVWDGLRAEWPRMRSEAHGRPRALVHGDYWPGNTVWLRGRLVGVVDWENPRVGDPDKDVGTCRADMWVLFGPQAADQFVGLYEAAAGRTVENLKFWDLEISAFAVPEMKDWALAYRLLGRPDVLPEVAVERIRAFARNALERA